MTLPELSARLERLSQMDDDRIFKLVLAEAYRSGQLVERDGVAGALGNAWEALSTISDASDCKRSRAVAVEAMEQIEPVIAALRAKGAQS